MITPHLADEAIARHVPPLGVVSRPLSECAGRVLRQDVHAERANPPFDRVCMDGIAVHSSALEGRIRRFSIQATQGAGSPPVTLRDTTFAVEVMTGAMLPHGTDMVIPLERYSLAGQVATLAATEAVNPYLNIQRCGEGGLEGSLMLRSGSMLGAPEIAVAASAGLSHLRVAAEPRLMIISTGDELVEPGAPIAEYQVRRSNVYAMIAALHAAGFVQTGNDHIVDDESALHERISLHLATHDVLILSGGVSMGKFDYVPRVLQRLGVTEIFDEVAQRPGRPMWFGIGPGGQAVFGLPGNPVSTLICLARYVTPALRAAAGMPRLPQESPVLTESVYSKLSIALFMPATVGPGQSGHFVATPRPTKGSGDYMGLVGTQGFLELPPGPATYPQGFAANLYRW